MGKLIIDGNSVYEIDEECLRKRGNHEEQREEAGREYGAEEKMKHKSKNNI